MHVYRCKSCVCGAGGVVIINKASQLSRQHCSLTACIQTLDHLVFFLLPDFEHSAFPQRSSPSLCLCLCPCPVMWQRFSRRLRASLSEGRRRTPASPALSSKSETERANYFVIKRFHKGSVGLTLGGCEGPSVPPVRSFYLICHPSVHVSI